MVETVRSLSVGLLVASMVLNRVNGAEKVPGPVWQSIGIGGGGAFFHAAGSPHDPDLVFVSSDMGGFYRSEDGGRSWRMLDWRMIMHSRPPVFDPKDPNRIYAISWGGEALRVSLDRGLTWERIDAGEAPWRSDALITLAVDRGWPAHMILSGEKGLYVTSEGPGTGWAAAPGAPGGVIGICIDQTSPLDKRRCFAANKGGVYRSDDGGHTWKECSNGLPWREIRSFCGGSDPKTRRVVLYCTIPSKKVEGKFAGGVYRSTDLGETWESAMGEGINVALGQHEWGESDIDQYIYLGMAETHPDTVYVTNRGTGYDPPFGYTVYRSDNAGKAWRACFFNEPRWKECNTEVGWLYYDRSRGWGGVAQTFTVNAGNPDQAFYTNDGEVFITMNGGKSWYQAYSKLVDPQPGKRKRWASIGIEDTSCWRYVFDPHEKNRHYICYTDIGLMRSEDGGKTWIDGTVGIPWKNTVYDLACDPDVPGLLYAACSNQHDIPHWRYIQGPAAPGGVCRSNDFGKTWAPIMNGLPIAPATSLVLDPTSPRDRRVLYAGLYGHGVFKSSDGGNSWVRKTEGIVPEQNRQVYSIRRWKDGTLFCTVAGRRKGRGLDRDLPGGLFKSSDGAETWKRISPDDIFRPVDFAIHPDDSGTIYVAAMDGLGHTGGVYKTTDGGQTWQNMNVPYDRNWCGYIEGFSVSLNPKDPNTVYFFTNTHGIFLSRDAGKTWSELRQPKAPPFMNCQRIYWAPDDPRTVYIVSFGGGVWSGVDPALQE